MAAVLNQILILAVSNGHAVIAVDLMFKPGGASAWSST